MYYLFFSNWNFHDGADTRAKASTKPEVDTVLVIIKLTKLSVTVRVHSLSLVRRRVTRRLTRLQTMCNVLKYRKIIKTLRCGYVAVAVIFSIYLKPVGVLYLSTNLFFLHKQSLEKDIELFCYIWRSVLFSIGFKFYS